MNVELQERLIERWPTWFHLGGRRNIVDAIGIQVGDGWFDLLWSLCVDLEPLLAAWQRESGCQFEVLEAWQKNGALSFVTNADDEMILAQIQQATLESLTICENCGKPGRLREGGLKMTLCDFCLTTQSCQLTW